MIISLSPQSPGIPKPYASSMQTAIRDTETVSLQNGIGNEEIISRYTDRVIGGMIITGFEWQGNAGVHVSVEAGPAKLGRFPAGLDGPVQRLVDCMAQAGIRVEGSADVRADLWGKTLYNCALNPLGAVMGVPYGKLAQPAAWRIIDQIVREGFSVIHAEGIRLPWASADEYLTYLPGYTPCHCPAPLVHAPGHQPWPAHRDRFSQRRHCRKRSRAWHSHPGKFLYCRPCKIPRVPENGRSATMRSAVVLAGGEARRANGQEKYFFTYEGKTFIERLVDSLSGVVDEIVIVARDPVQCTRF